MADDYSNNTQTLGLLLPTYGGTVSMTGNLEVVGDQDWFKVTLKAGQLYHFELDGLASKQGTLLDPLLTLRDASGAVISSNDDAVSSTRDSAINYQPTVSGDYYLAAGTFEDSGSGTYKVKVANAIAVDSANAQDVAIKGNYAYIADDSAGLKIVDISDPLNPVLTGKIQAPYYSSVDVSGNYAYLFDRGYYKFKAFNISDPANPVLAGSRNVSSSSYDLEVHDNYAYVALSSELDIIDISNPATPNLTGKLVAGAGYGLSVNGNYAYVNGDNAFKIVDISSPAEPKLIGKLNLNYGKDVAVSNGYAFATSSEGITVIDIKKPASPILVNTFKTAGSASDITIIGKEAYVAISTGLQIIDISDPFKLVSEAVANTPGTAKGFAISGNYAYVASGNSGLQILALPKAAAANTAPTGTPTAVLSGIEDTAYLLKTADLLQGFTDANSDTLSVKNLSANPGTLTDNGDGTWTLNTAANFNGKVALAYTVSDGKGGTLTAQLNLTLAAVNDAPTGTVSLDNTAPQQGQTLTAQQTLADADGLGTITYQWSADGGVVGTGDTYAVTESDVGKALMVKASYTDGNGTEESVNSVATAKVLPLAATNAAVSFTGSDFSTSEAGDSAMFQVALAAQPVRDVTLNFTSTNTAEGMLSTPSLTFTAANWSTPQTLTVVGVDDSVVDNSIPFNVTTSISSLDVLYNNANVTIAPLSLSNLNDDDVIYGDVGGAKIDVLNGGTGEDVLYGKDMNDDVSGGTGNDTQWGGYGNDVLSGNDGNDQLNGEQDNDYLDGGAGNDTLDGGVGLDTLIGGAGNDTYYLGYDAVDVINDGGLSSDVDTVIMPYQLNKYTLPTGIENGTISPGTQTSSLIGNTSDNRLVGNDGKNTLGGAVGRDSLFAGNGNDVLDGGVDSDTLTGGKGKDSFVFDSSLSSTNVDKITDFKPIDDTIKLDNQIFTQLTGLGVLNADFFVKGANALAPNDYVIYNPATGTVIYDSDGSGAGFGVQIAALGVNLNVTNADFVVI